MKGLVKFLIVFVVLLMLALVLANNLGFNLRNIFPGSIIPAFKSNEDSLGCIEILVKENQIYYNDKLVDLEKLKEKLTNLETDEYKVRLREKQSKRVTYKEVENLLKELEIQFIEVTENTNN
ncbi:MAG: hypothetical protein KAX49_07120 [Halanaerobiales bacterium]|nr:hypothetical protein [Halanaerobiales bacterium]